MRYLFQIGKTPLLSLAELAPLFSGTQIIEYHPSFILIERPEPLSNFTELQDRLGGTLKVTKLISEYSSLKWQIFYQKICSDLITVIENSTSKSKITFAINIYPPENRTYIFQKRLLLDIKKRLKISGHSCRFANKNFQNLVTAVTIKEKLTADGLEFNLFFGADKFYLTQSLTIQNIDQYGQRDYQKPARNPQSGMLPPKLAQIMINLANAPLTSTIYDPFCGTGTILMEALLMGYSVIGSDISASAISESDRNLNWFNRNFSEKFCKKYQLFSADATVITNQQILAHFPSNISDFSSSPQFSIVSEPFLGPILKKIPSEKEIFAIQKPLKKLYLDFFANLHQNCPAISNIVIIFPYIKTPEKRYHLNIISEILQLGFQQIPLIPEILASRLELKAIKTLLYERPDQIIGREIAKFAPPSYFPKN